MASYAERSRQCLNSASDPEADVTPEHVEVTRARFAHRLKTDTSLSPAERKDLTETITMLRDWVDSQGIPRTTPPKEQLMDAPPPPALLPDGSYYCDASFDSSSLVNYDSPLLVMRAQGILERSLISCLIPALPSGDKVKNKGYLYTYTTVM